MCYENRTGFDHGDILIINLYSSGQDTLYLYTTTVWRPKGPTGGAIIEAKHDLEMFGISRTVASTTTSFEAMLVKKPG